MVGSTSIKNRDNSNCLFPYVRFLPKVHGDRVIYVRVGAIMDRSIRFTGEVVVYLR